MGEAGLLSGVANHPLRDSLTEEMHVRKLPPLRPPAQILQMLMLFEAGAGAESVRHLDRLAAGDPPLPAGLRYHRRAIGPIELVWERHTEYASYTFIREGGSDPLFSLEPFAALDQAWVDSMPGALIRATRVALVPSEAEPDKAALAGYFSANDLVVADAAGGAARLYSDFRLHREGTGRLLIVDRGLRGAEAGQIVRRVQELGNYRKMALLGLPVAQAGAGRLDQLEARLAALIAGVAEDSSEPAALLDELSALSAELAALTAATRYRMGASRAYGGIVQDRLQSLKAEAAPGYSSLDDFTERRLLPALRTCASFSERLDDLAGRAEWTSALLRTRIETALSAQNRDLLASMDRRASAQLRLQQTVEGLSVFAISYYAIGLLAYALKPLHRLAPWLDGEGVTALAVPAILVAVWLGLRRLRRHWHDA